VTINWRRLLLGRPLRTERAAHERLTILLALPIFASDALSSVAYATEAILLQFADAHLNRSQFTNSLPISVAIIALILMVVISYRQVIYAYPGGGGSYIVAKENLGELAGLTAASSLLVDYVLTVAVSIAEGTAAALAALNQISPWFQHLEEHRVLICCALVLFVMLLNLRGVRESGIAFAVPSYLFIVSIITLIVVGVYRSVFGIPPVEAVAPPSLIPTGGVSATGLLTVFLLLRAFASGCSALTGIEAVSNGVQAFKKPEARNASVTLIILGSLLAVMFIGITYLANHYGIVPGEHLATYGGVNRHEPVVSQVARATFGTSIFYYVIQAATATILLLAANTSFAGFPRLASILAEDGYLPRYFANLGDRLAYNNGIIVLALLAIVFIVIFGGETHALLPLYTVGVFIAFTLSQAGMVSRWIKLGKLFSGSAFVNALGCCTTFLVLIVVVMSKGWVRTPEATLFHIGSVPIQEGAWIAILLMGFQMWICKSIATHYRIVNAQLAEIPIGYDKPVKHTVIVLVPSRIHRGVVHALSYARSISPDAMAVHIMFDRTKEQGLRDAWEVHGNDVPLIILDSPYRSLVGPLMDYLDAADRVRNDDIITVVLPEFVPARWWHHFLHNASGWLLRLLLFYRRDIVITSIRYYLEE
jgi:amino acid transporter